MLPQTGRPPVRLMFALIITLLIIGAVSGPLMARAAPLARQATPTSPVSGTESVPLFGLLELSFSLSETYDNPYDPAEIEVVATFLSPDGRTITVPGFFMHPYQDACSPSDCPAEDLQPAGPAEWRIRFSPDEVGGWRYLVEARDTDGTDPVQRGTFEVVPSTNPGFVRASGRYFAFDDGSAYFPVGENLAWSSIESGGLYAYERWLDQLQAAGVNFARLNIDIPWFVGLEWAAPAGNYNAAQDAAWRLDQIVRLAEEKGIYLQIGLIWHQSFALYADPPVPLPTGLSPPVRARFDWTAHPYNAANGGPLNSLSDFFTDEEAQRLLRQRLRYSIARWGYSPHIFAWEIVDEMDGLLGYTGERAHPWLRALTDYVREIDPYDHLITAGSRQPNPDLWETLDFVLVRHYQGRPAEEPVDQVATVLSVLSEVFAYTSKPVLLSEFSLNRWYPPVDDDPAGIHVHNTIWTAALAGTAGGAMPWWWDSYIDSQNLYRLFDPLVSFTRNIPWNSADLEPVNATLMAESPLAYGPLRVDNFNRAFPGESPPDVIYRLTPDGPIPSTSRMSSYLYGAFNPERSRPQTFIVSPPVDAELRILIQNVSATAPAALSVNVDGVETARIDFSVDSQNILVVVPLRAGEHVVVLDNPGQDWLQLAYLEVTQYRAPVRALALADRQAGFAAAWVHHRDYTWQRAAGATTLEALNFALHFAAMPPGVYRVTFWDTSTGTVIGEEYLTLAEDSDGILRLKLLPITSQLAVHAFRVAGPSVAPQPQTGRLATRTPSITLTATPVVSDTPEPTATSTATQTLTPTETPTNTSTPTPSPSHTHTPTDTVTPTHTATASHTATLLNSPTPSWTPSPSMTRTPSQTPTTTRTPSRTPIATPTRPIGDPLGIDESTE